MHHQISVAYEGIDSDTAPNVKLSAKYTKSFAYYTVKDRLPVILTKVINELATSKAKLIKQHGQGTDEDLKSVIGKVSKLKNELVTNKSFIKLCSKEEDIEDWNDYLESQTNLEDEPPCWYYSPWLYAECYMYRRLREAFENSEKLQGHDPFQYEKEDAFRMSLSDIKFVGEVTLKTLSQINTCRPDFKQIVVQFVKLSLWSNRCDLSLSNGAQFSTDDLNLHNVSVFDSFLLCDNSENLFNLLNDHPNGVIDFVNDNSSYEVFCDFCLCDILCSTFLASKIRFHVKRMPWYVSDVTIKDINWLLNELKKEGMEELSSRWEKYFQDGTWSVSDEKYWTLPFDYSDMKSRDFPLYDSLKASNLVIFKGDLNYRKLLGDINWDPFEKFEVAIREFKPTNVLSLRTVKADLICGMNPQKYKYFNKENKMWMRTGEYGLIQFYHHV